MKKVISMMVILCTMLLVCVNPVLASRHRHKTFGSAFAKNANAEILLCRSL